MNAITKVTGGFHIPAVSALFSFITVEQAPTNSLIVLAFIDVFTVFNGMKLMMAAGLHGSCFDIEGGVLPLDGAKSGRDGIKLLFCRHKVARHSTTFGLAQR